MIFLFFTNINGLLNWEDFARHGSVKFPDYGFILAILIIIYILLLKRFKVDPIYNTNNSLLLLIYFDILYYLFLFIYSILLQGSIEWPLKIGRYYLYGISIIAFYLLLVTDPIIKFRKVVNFLKIYTIVFSIMYIIYSYFNINFYADVAYDTINTDNGTVNRNFAAFPYFLMYFYCISLIDLLNRKGNYFINLLLIFLYLICMVSVLTRGLIISAIIILITAFIISDNRKANIFYLSFSFGLGIIILRSIHYFESNNFSTLLVRFSEVTNVGIRGTENFQVRTNEFLNVLNNVIHFNPLFGFGFVNTSLLGLYRFNNFTAGSPDNGFTNLLGTTGFVGLVIFITIIIKWVLINVKLQRFKNDDFSKAHFLFIIYLLLSFMNGSSNSYLETFGLFLIYDLLIFKKYIKSTMKISNIVPS
jgi:hypothetical protein